MSQAGTFTDPESALVRFEPDSAPPSESLLGEKDGRPAQINDFDPTTPFSEGAERIITADGYVERREHGILRLAEPWAEFISDIVRLDKRPGPVPVPPRPPGAALPRLVASGKFFQTDTGERITIVMTSDFNLPSVLVDQGEAAVCAVFAQRQACGFNCVRVFTDYDIQPASVPPEMWIGKFLVSEHPDAYERVYPRLVELAAPYGIYLQFVAYTGYHHADHWHRLGEGLREHFCFLSLVNEYDHAAATKREYLRWEDFSEDEREEIRRRAVPRDGINWIPGIEDFQSFPWLLCSRGSNTSDSWPPEPAMDFVEYHIISSEWQRKVGHNCMEVADAFDRPGLTTETPRGGDHYDEVVFAQDASEGAGLLCAGSCYHSPHGKNSQLFAGAELELARAWGRGAAKVPLQYQDGFYRHHQEMESDTVIRVYSRTIAEGSYFVQIHG